VACLPSILCLLVEVYVNSLLLEIVDHHVDHGAFLTFPAQLDGAEYLEAG
jgi:hypothetical protein